MSRTWALASLILLALMCTVTAAPDRIALVVANSDYGATSARDVPQAQRDGALVASVLRDLDFELTSLADADLATLRGAIADFGRTLRDAGPDAVGLFYYAGHAVQSFGVNYLLPTDVSVTGAGDLDLLAIDADAILRQLRAADVGVGIVVLDASHSDPLASMVLPTRGLAEIDVPAGLLVAFAAQPDAVVTESTGVNGHYASALAARMADPTLAIEPMFRRASDDVAAMTDGRQVPWTRSKLTRAFQLAPASAPARPTVEPSALSEPAAEPPMQPRGLVFVAPTAEAVIKSVWDRIAKTRDREQIELFVAAYPDSAFVDDALALLDTMGAPKPLQPPAPEADDTNQPGRDELASLEMARRMGEVAPYEAYLATYPDGTFSELARSELAALREAASEADAPDPVPAGDARTEVAAIDPDAAPSGSSGSAMTFATPIVEGSAETVGRSIEELIAGSPLFPPVEGLPESYWRDQSCSNCHQWQRDNLCTQASTYLDATDAQVGAKSHPYGGGFKRALRAWAAAGCF